MECMGMIYQFHLGFMTNKYRPIIDPNTTCLGLLARTAAPEVDPQTTTRGVIIGSPDQQSHGVLHGIFIHP